MNIWKLLFSQYRGWLARSRRKYLPHQGQREMQRRRRQMGAQT